MSQDYIPERGDVIWIDFDPQVGREQRGRRPAVVLSPRIYNERSTLAWICPVTSKSKGYPFEIGLPDTLPIQGVVLADQVRSLDYRGRKAVLIGQLPQSLCKAIRERAKRLLE